jgi:hypothetical protein
MTLNLLHLFLSLQMDPGSSSSSSSSRMDQLKLAPVELSWYQRAANNPSTHNTTQEKKQNLQESWNQILHPHYWQKYRDKNMRNDDQLKTKRPRLFWHAQLLLLLVVVVVEVV